MTEAEQKQRNCESAKRSRLKKQQELEDAKELALRLQEENNAWRSKFAQVRQWSFDMAVHRSLHHKDCECSSAAWCDAVEAVLASPRGARSNHHQLQFLRRL